MLFEGMAIGMAAMFITCALWRRWRIDHEALDATNEDCNAGDAIVDWALAHPFERVWNSDEGRALVLRAIRADFRFKYAHPFLPKEDQRLVTFCSLIAAPEPPIPLL